jgi:hypothetical protein
MKYIIKLNDKIISKRNTKRDYNYCWVRVVQKEETTYFYKNTGETISFKDTYPFTKQIVLNGQKVNPLRTINGISNHNEQDAISWGQYEKYIDKTKTITKLLNDSYVFNECSLYLNQNWINWKQDRLLFSEFAKFSEEINGVRTVEFKHYANNESTEKKVA